MKQSTLILLLCLFIPFKALYAQKQANIWYFGAKAGIDFNSGAPVALTNGQLDSREGCATICDKSGALLFYTDGDKVWNKNHAVMPNGTSLGGHSSSTQSAIAVPKPGSATQYYIFTVDAWAGTHSTGNGGVSLNLVDMSLNGGLGDVTTKNQTVATPTCEKLTATRHCNGQDFWIVTHLWGSDTIYAYLLTPAGLAATPVKSNSGVVMKDRGKKSVGDPAEESIGYMKISPDGQRIAFACYSNLHCVAMGLFDNKTGMATGFQVDSFPDIHSSYGLYGVAFSPSSNLLYMSNADSGKSEVYQYDLTAAVPPTTRLLIKSNTAGQIYGALQLAPDGKIYMAKSGWGKLDVIKNPDSPGAACNYTVDAFMVGTPVSHNSEIGLPDFIENFIIPPFQASLSYQDCTGAYDSLFVDSNITHPITIAWDFGDAASGPDNTSTLTNPAHSFSASGTYTVTANVTYACGSFAITKNITISSGFGVEAGPDKTILPGNSVTLQGASSAPGTYTWSPGESLSDSTILTPLARPEETTTYTLSVTNTLGCTSMDTVIITVDRKSHLYLPNAFSPNADGFNDLFTYIASGITDIDVKIFNRWGQMVYHSTRMDENWDGTFNGEPAPVGAYVYLVTATGADGVAGTWKGNLTLIR